jgi:type VI secretion system secreted protein VgrG
MMPQSRALLLMHIINAACDARIASPLPQILFANARQPRPAPLCITFLLIFRAQHAVPLYRTFAGQHPDHAARQPKLVVTCLLYRSRYGYYRFYFFSGRFMNSMFAQGLRMGRLSTVLGPDVLVLKQFTGHEAINANFLWHVDCIAVSGEIDFDGLIGTHATVTLVTQSGDRPFDGIVTEAQWLGAGEDGLGYRLVLKPWFHLASLRRNQRIFHNLTVVQILEQLLAAYASAGTMTSALVLEYPKLEYTVQYRESDQDFARRMMERHGISFHFQHQDGAHQLVLTDSVDSHASIGMRPFFPPDGHHAQEVEHFNQWHPARRMTTGAIRLTDYNFKTPNAAMGTDHTGDAAYAEGKIESFDWPGGYPDQGRGRVVARMRTEGERGQDRRYEATGDIAGLAAGHRVVLGGDTVPGTGEEFLCLTATHSYASNSYGSTSAVSQGPAYVGRYVLMPASAPLVPEQKTTRADVKGPQTAVVVGEGEIDCDEYGRILVKFHWDLASAHSMRCRVSQNWAGNGWGGMIIPRIGMEVVVEFLDGDPDQPLVTGCVYNGRNKVPYALPANKTRSTFKTDTHQGSGFNEVRFEDEKSREEIYIHAQKDRNEKTLHDHSERIDNNWVQSVGHNKSIEVTNNHVEAIGGNLAISVGPTSIGQVVNQGLIGLAGGIGKVAKGLGLPGLLNPGEGNMALTVEKAKAETIGTISAVTVGISHFMTVGRSIEITSGNSMSTTVAERSTESVGKTMAIEGDLFTLTVGASRLEMKKDGTITLKGKNIEIEGTSSVRIKSAQIDNN